MPDGQKFRIGAYILSKTRAGAYPSPPRMGETLSCKSVSMSRTVVTLRDTLTNKPAFEEHLEPAIGATDTGPSRCDVTVMGVANVCLASS